MIGLGVIVLLFVGYQLFGTALTEEHNQATLAKQFATALASRDHTETAAAVPGATPTTTVAPLPSVPTGGAIDHLVIPKLDHPKGWFVVEGTEENDLREGPGHYTGTAYPGQIGNVGIAGHRTTYGAPFFELNKMAAGDLIYLTDLEDRTWVYKVTGPPVVVSPNDTAVLDPTTFAQLTLTTCNPRFSATTRLIVFARLVGRALPAAPASKTTPAPAVPAIKTLAGVDNLGSGNHKAWPPTIGYGLVVVLGWIATRLWINRSRRWHRLTAYVVGFGICLIPLWFLFENVILLLPQSI